MKKFIKSAFTAFIVCSISLWSSAQTTQKIQVPADPAKWITSTFAKGKIPPLSFVYDGKKSSEFLKSWKYSIRKETDASNSNVLKYCVSYSDAASGMRLDCHIYGYKEFNAVEWVLNFTNTSDKNSGTIENVNALDLNILCSQSGTFTLHHAKGSNAERSDFMPASTAVTTEKMHFAPEGGRSSDNTAFPFFNIETPDKQGLVLSIGWTGTWFASIAKQSEKELSLQSGMENMKLYLYPNESIRTPRISILFWKDKDRMAGNNKFRRFVLAHHTRKINGEIAEYPLCGGFDWGDPAPCNEYSCLTEDYAISIIRRHKQFGIVPDVFWLDAGWYTGSGGPDFSGGNWATNVGNWTVDATRFPRGLKPLSDEAHKIGAKFMVWFEPERVIAGTQFAKEHPEWMLKISGNDTYLFDLGNKEACAWLSKYIGDMIEANGIDYYRQDFNMHPRPYWEANDAPGRTGIKEIRHIEGLYAYWDYLLKRFPNLLIDNCASGGRRLDLEMTERSAPLWRTDYQYGEPNGYQCHTYGLNFFLPMHGTGIYKTDDYSFRSSLSSAMVFNWEINGQNVSIPDMQRCIAKYRELRPYYYEDFYPLTGCSDLTGEDVWLAYQLNKPSDNTGIVIGFRRKENKDNTISVSLRGLDPSITYQVINENNGASVTKTGKELETGITLTIDDAPGSVLLKYKKMH